MYGDLIVRYDRGRLVLHFGPSFTGDLTHWQYDTFLARWRNIREGRAFVDFHIGLDGAVETVDVQGIAPFSRVPDTTGGR